MWLCFTSLPTISKQCDTFSRIWNLGYFDINSCRFYRNAWRVCLVPKHLLCLIYPHRLSRYSDDLKLRKWEGAQLAKVWHRVWLRLKYFFADLSPGCVGGEESLLHLCHCIQKALSNIIFPGDEQPSYLTLFKSSDSSPLWRQGGNS